MLAKDMMSVGQPAEFSIREGYPGTSAVTGAGTTTTDATVLLKEQRVILAAGASNSGIRLPSTAELMVPYIVAVTGANTVKIYPPTSGTINGGSADASVAIVTTLCGVFMRYSSTGWLAFGTVAAA